MSVIDLGECALEKVVVGDLRAFWNNFYVIVDDYLVERVAVKDRIKVALRLVVKNSDDADAQGLFLLREVCKS
jgi:hypothetical protein